MKTQKVELKNVLAESQTLTHAQQAQIKGGCTSCEDIRRPPGGNGNSNAGGKNRDK